MKALRRLRKLQLEEHMAWGAGSWSESDYVFTAEDGQPLHPSLAWRLEKAVKATGVSPLSFHGQRHTCATIALTQGVPAKVVQEMLGHSSISITLDLYTHVMPGMQEDSGGEDRRRGVRGLASAEL